MTLNIICCLKIVLALVRQNIIKWQFNPSEHDRQVKACDILEEIINEEFDYEDD